MHRVKRIIKDYKEYFTFVALVIISLILISSSDISRLGGFRTVVIGTIGWMQSAFSWIPDTGALKSENKTLRELNLQLNNEVSKMRISIIENKKLKALIKLKSEIKYETISADVIGKTDIELRNYYMLNQGKADGVRTGMSVRTDAGLVGVIAGVTEHYSLVELIINRNVKIAGMVQRTRYDGILSWAGSQNFSLNNIPKSYDVIVGDTIVTSNYSDKYPSNLPIGYVVNKLELPGDIFARISVKPFVNFATLEQVFILKFIPDEERQKLIDKMDEKLKARKNLR